MKNIYILQYFIVLLLLPVQAFAYLDLGSGSYFIQLLLGFFSVFLLTFNSFFASFTRRVNISVLGVVVVALFPGLALYSFNIEQTYFRSIIISLLATVAGAYTLYGVLYVIFRSTHKATVGTSIGILIFFSFGHLNAFFGGMLRDRYIVVLVATLFGAALAYLFFAKKGFVKLSASLGIVFLVLSASSLAYAGIYNISHRIESEDGPTIAGSGVGSKPDIYYIILDGYGRQDTMSHLYGFDNEPFLKELEKRGFFIARESISNYAQTHLSLSSTLNFEYLETDLTGESSLQAEIEKLADDSQDRTYVYNAVKNNALLRFLKSAGYKSVHIASGRTDMTDQNEFANINIKGGGAE